MSNRAALRSMYDAVIAGDLSTLLTHLHDEVVLHEPPFLPYGGEYRGKEAFTGLVMRVPEVFDFSRMRVQDMVVDGDEAVVLVEIPRTGLEEYLPLAEHWTFRDGKAAQVRIYTWDPTTLMAAVDN